MTAVRSVRTAAGRSRGWFGTAMTRGDDQTESVYRAGSVLFRTAAYRFGQAAYYLPGRARAWRLTVVVLCTSGGLAFAPASLLAVATFTFECVGRMVAGVG